VQVTINTLSPTEREAAFEVPDEELQQHFDLAYEKFRPKAELKGFRKGKVPLPMIKQLYGEAIEHDALDDIANTLYRKAMEERKIQPIGTPSMVGLDFKRKQHLRFTVKYEVKPEIVLGDYKGLVIEKPVRTVTDKEVDDELHHLRQANSTTVDTEAVTDTEHIVLADVQELDDSGAPLIGKKTADAKFYLADPALAPEIREALKTARAGETYGVRYESKHEDHTHRHHFNIAVTKVQKVSLPPFDEALVRKLTGDKVSSPEEFRKEIRADLERYWEEQGNARVNDAIANEVVRLHDFPVPETLTEAFLQSFIDDVKTRSRDRRLPAGFDEQKFRTENRAYATWQAKWMLLKEAIAEKENLTVTDEDVAALAEQEAARIGIDKARLMEYYKKSNSASERLLSDKVVGFLKSNATVQNKLIAEQNA
jgi:trigger factor